MTTSLQDTKRSAIAEKLASMRAVQQLLINNEQQFLQECDNQDIRNRLQDMLEDDQKNLGIIETAIIEYGIQAEPKETVKKFTDRAKEMMQGSDLTLYEKVVQHELLKHGQVMSGLVVHKAGQVTGADIQQALAPLNAVNFENRAHQEQLKSIVEYLGTKELTGQEPDQSFWGRIQDAMAAATGIFGGAVTQATDKDDMDITTLIFMDHQKVKTLFREIEWSSDSQKIGEYFAQVYADLLVHAKAEEQEIYPNVRSFYGQDDTQELYDEQAQLEKVLKEAKQLSPGSEEFKSKFKQIKDMVGDHTRQEETTMFAAIRKNCSEDQREQMATRFKEAKKQLQSQLQSESKV